MSYSRRRLLRANENIPNSLPRDVPKHNVVKETGNNSTTSAPETGNTHRQRTDKRFSDSDDLGLFSHVDDIEDTTHSFANLFFNSHQTPKPSTSAMEIPTSTQPTGTIYPWLNSTNIQNNEAVRENNKNDKGNLSKQERKDRRKARKETRNKHENLDNVDINVNVEGRRRNKWKKNRKEKIREQVQKMCSGGTSSMQMVGFTRSIPETNKPSKSHQPTSLKDQNTFSKNVNSTSNELQTPSKATEGNSVSHYGKTHLQFTSSETKDAIVHYTYNMFSDSSREDIFSPTPSSSYGGKGIQVSTSLSNDESIYQHYTTYIDNEYELQQQHYLKQEHRQQQQYMKKQQQQQKYMEDQEHKNMEHSEKHQQNQQHKEQTHEKHQNKNQQQQKQKQQQQNQQEQQQEKQQSTTKPLSTMDITTFNDAQQSTIPAEEAQWDSIASSITVSMRNNIVSSSSTNYHLATNVHSVVTKQMPYTIGNSHAVLLPSYSSLIRTPLVSAQSSNPAAFTFSNLQTTFLESDQYIYETENMESSPILDHFMSIRPSFTSVSADINLGERSSYENAESFGVSAIDSTEYLDNSLFVDATAIDRNVYSTIRTRRRNQAGLSRNSLNKTKRVSKRKRFLNGINNKIHNITTLRGWRKRNKIKIPRRRQQKKRQRTKNKRINATSSEILQATTILPNTTENGANINKGFDSNIRPETEIKNLPGETNNDFPPEENPVNTGEVLNNDTGFNLGEKSYNRFMSEDEPNSGGTNENGNTGGMDPANDTSVSGHDGQPVDNNETGVGAEKDWYGYPNYDYHDYDAHNDTMIPGSAGICEWMDFIGAQGKRCCQKSIKCFGDLPELIDEIETYNNSEDQDDLQRQHVCQHIKNSMLCMGHAMALPVCKSSVTFVHRKLNDTLSDVTKFHAESCQKGSSTPTIIPSTTRHTAPPGGIGSRSGIKPHTHDHTNYAAIVGGVAGGLILVFLIVLIVLLLRKNKSKRPTSEFRVKDVDGDMNLSNGSSRYKNHIGLSRNHSEVYAEIDESSMHSNQSFPDKRPLPSAPSNGPISSDNTGYLTPRGSREALGLPNDRDSGGYHVLQKEANRKPSVDAYEKLHNEEGEYIEPTNNSDRRVRVPSQKPPKNNNQDVPKPTDDNYHMYFVLEKDSAVHV